VNAAETHETIHWESGMRYQIPHFRPDLSSDRASLLPDDGRKHPYRPASPQLIALRILIKHSSALSSGAATGQGPRRARRVVPAARAERESYSETSMAWPDEGLVMAAVRAQTSRGMAD